jgi:ribosomal protein S18 acetylase RimI-like enzyme
MNISYHYDKQLAFSQAFTFVFEGYASMLRENLTHPCMDFTNSTEIVYAKDADTNKVVCAQLFVVDPIGRCFTLYAYTHPDYRGHGIAVKVFEHLERQLKGRPGTLVVYTNCVDENGAIKKVFEKTGREQYAIKFTKYYKDAEQL